MDIYVVTEGRRVVGASARLQGAELIRSDETTRLATSDDPDAIDMRRHLATWNIVQPSAIERHIYERLTIHNTELRDTED